ncbi:PFN [Mytilus coruscus]|uniref:Profilin n=1 Tax=Mytilus coruscus TaxID=42192 RepID=A0A6J8CEG9_MYTCO|nr:PFN [Mytilus coruscus]
MGRKIHIEENEKGNEIPPFPVDSQMPCTWKEYVNNVLLDSGYVSRAAILGNDGKSWATSTGFYVSPAELREIIPAFVDSTKIRNDGIYLNNKRYTCTRMDSTIMVGREIATGFGCVVFKCKTCLIVGVYEDGAHPGGCYNMISKIGDYLKDQGY